MIDMDGDSGSGWKLLRNGVEVVEGRSGVVTFFLFLRRTGMYPSSPGGGITSGEGVAVAVSSLSTLLLLLLLLLLLSCCT